MSDSSPSLKEWKNLYKAAIEFKEIESWNWMFDTDMFGVQNPGNGEIGYCCVLGNLGEVFSLNVYLGTEGLEGYLKIRSGRIAPGDIESMHVQNCLTASFVDRQELQERDLEIIKKLGLKFRGRNEWPLFRRYEPGFYPWYITREEAKFLTIALQQAKNVALRFKENRDLLNPPKENLYLVMVPEKRGKGITWKEEWLEPEPLKKREMIIPEIEKERLKRVRKAISKKGGGWEVEIFYSPFTIQEKKDERPHHPFTCLFLDHYSGLIIGFQISEHSGYQEEFQEKFLSLIEESKSLPEEVLVKRDEAYRLFKPITKELGINLRLVERLKLAKEAIESMFEYMSENPPPDLSF
jgi:hypothetical protein